MVVQFTKLKKKVMNCARNVLLCAIKFFLISFFLKIIRKLTNQHISKNFVPMAEIDCAMHF